MGLSQSTITEALWRGEKGKRSYLSLNWSTSFLFSLFYFCCPIDDRLLYQYSYAICVWLWKAVTAHKGYTRLRIVWIIWIASNVYGYRKLNRSMILLHRTNCCNTMYTSFEGSYISSWLDHKITLWPMVIPHAWGRLLPHDLQSTAGSASAVLRAKNAALTMREMIRARAPLSWNLSSSASVVHSPWVTPRMEGIKLLPAPTSAHAQVRCVLLLMGWCCLITSRQQPIQSEFL